MIFATVVIILLAIAYVGLPFWAKLLVFAFNSVFPDPIPIIDEVLMVVAIINDFRKLYIIMNITEWMHIHKKLIMCVLIVILITIICFVYTNVQLG